MWASCSCFHLCLVSPRIYPEAILTSFVYSVSYRAHGGGSVALFVWWPKHCTRQ